MLYFNRALNCIGYLLLSVNENLCLTGGIKKVVGLDPRMWNDGTGILRVLIGIPLITTHPYIYYQLI